MNRLNRLAANSRDAVAGCHEDGQRLPLAENLDGKLLSTAVAGGFVGVTLGPHTRLEQR